MTRRALVLLLLLLSATSLSAARRRAVRSPARPDGPCAVRGAANLFYSTDGGATWSKNAETPTKAGAWDLIVIEGNPETILAVAGRDVYASTDGGCTFALQHTITLDIHHTLHAVPASEGRAFLWWEEEALRYDRGTVTRLPIPNPLGGLGVDPGNRDHVRMLDVDTARVRESFDGGDTWTAIGNGAGGRVNSAAFDPNDFNHILAGLQTQGIAITRDAGRTWTNGARANTVCYLAFVASQPNVVWATLPVGNGTPFVYRSTDAGVRLEAIGGFTNVSPNVCLPVIPNPHDATKAWVPFIDSFLFDAVQKSVTPWSCCGGRFARIAWAPNDASRVYVYEGAR